MNLVTTQEMLEIDARAQHEFLIPGLLLMEQAGVKGFHAAVDNLSIQEDQSVLFIVGSGNNGGDALVMAREASMMGYSDIKVLCLKKEQQEVATLHLNICKKLDLPIYYIDSDDWQSLITEADLVFDGMVGTGLKGALRQCPMKELIEFVNCCTDATRVAIDLPSGLTDLNDGDAIVFNADLTISFGPAKLCCYLPLTRMRCGEIIQINPGFPDALISQYGSSRCLIEMNSLSLKHVEPTSYKNKKGHLVVFAGSVGYTGAAALCSEAALRTGAGLVTLFCDSEVYPILASSLRSVIVRPLVESTYISAIELRSSYDAILTGPGWGEGSRRETQMIEILGSGLPLILDADGIKVYSRIKETLQELRQPKEFILTPHPGEFRVLYNESDHGSLQQFVELLQGEAVKHEAVILYKSFINYLVDPHGGLSIMEGLNPELGTAGSGDVLAGIIAGLLTLKENAKSATVIGNCIHQLAGRSCRAEMGTFIAEDLLQFIGTTRKELEKDG